MKKLFTIILAIIVLFASCAKVNEISKDINSVQTEIIFNTGAASTKAIVTDTTIVDNFGVYGYVTGSVLNPGYIMNNAKYQPDGTSADGSKYYWPKSDNANNVDILFTGYSQYDGNINHDDITGELVITIPSLTQNLINNEEDFDDVLWTQTNANNHQYSTGDKYIVPLVFHHSLSWIQFNGIIDDVDEIVAVEIKSIRFSDAIYTDGELVLNTKNVMTQLPSIRNISNPDNFDFSTDTIPSLNKSIYTQISNALIIPQDVPESITVVFDITIHNIDADSIKYQNRTITRTINTGKDAHDQHTYVNSWLPSNKYIYNFRFTVDNIQFEAKVVDWIVTNNEYHVWDY